MQRYGAMGCSAGVPVGCSTALWASVVRLHCGLGRCRGAQGPQPPPLPSRPPPPLSAAAPIHHRRGRLAHGPARPPRCQNAAEERRGGVGGGTAVASAPRCPRTMSRNTATGPRIARAGRPPPHRASLPLWRGSARRHLRPPVGGGGGGAQLPAGSGAGPGGRNRCRCPGSGGGAAAARPVPSGHPNAGAAPTPAPL